MFVLEKLPNYARCCKMEPEEAENEVKGRPRSPDDGERRMGARVNRGLKDEKRSRTGKNDGERVET